MKRNVSIILIALMLLSLIPINIVPIVGAEDPSGGIIDGDSIYWENSWGRLEVYPHTSWGDIHQEQYCNATWKLASTNLDIAFRFDIVLIDAHIYEWVDGEWVERTDNFEHTTLGEYEYYYVTNTYFEQDETRRFKWNYDVPFNTSGKWDFMAKLSSESIQYALDNNRYVMLDPWWNSNWNFYRILTIESDYVDTDLLNFPVMVLIPDSIENDCDGGDSIRFLNMDNTTEYYYEIESWNTTGDSYVWVNVTSIQSDSDTQFIMYYGNTDASDNQNPTQVWDDHFVLVLHMFNGTDSTNSYNNATDRNIAGGTAIANITTGKMGNAKDFESDNTQYLNISHTTSLNLNDSTLEVWMNRESQSDMSFFAKTIIPKYTDFYFDAPANRLVYESGSTGQALGNTSNLGSANIWYYCVATRDRAPGSGKLILYTNGTIDGEPANAPDEDITTNVELYIGLNNANVRPFDGIFDEMRISNIVRNASWINATYHSINIPTQFCLIGGVIVNPAINLSTNTTTNITRTSATLNAYLPSNSGNFDGVYTVGFWYGTNDPPTDADTNISFGDITITGGINFDSAITSLTENLNYYVKAWAFNGTVFFEAANVNSFITNQSPQVPTNVVASILTNSSLEVTWIAGIATSNTTIVRKIGSFPSTPTDGTVVFNNSIGDVDFYAEDLTGNYFFRMWGWNTTYDEHSADYADVEYGTLLLSCFNESSPMEALTFDILIKNADGTDVFNGSGLTNIHVVDINDIPFGTNTQMIVNSSGYNQRIYYFDLEENNIYNINFYLSFANNSELYLLHVEDRSEQPLDLVKIQVQRYMNTTGVYESVSIILTDGAGDTLVNLIPNVPYQITLSKDLYVMQIADYTTSPDVFIKNFVMDRTEDVENVTKFLDTIIFTGEWILSNNTLHIHYFDKEDNTTNTAFQIWEVGNFTEFLNATYTFTTESDIHIYVSGLNLNRTHKIEIDLNHTTIGQIVDQPIYVYPAFKPGITIRNLDWLEQLFIKTWGSFEMGYIPFFLIFLPCFFILIVFAKHPGLGVLGSASYITFISGFMEITLALLGVASLLFTIGIIIIITKRGKKITT